MQRPDAPIASALLVLRMDGETNGTLLHCRPILQGWAQQGWAGRVRIRPGVRFGGRSADVVMVGRSSKNLLPMIRSPSRPCQALRGFGAGISASVAGERLECHGGIFAQWQDVSSNGLQFRPRASPATVVYSKRGLGITALEPTRGR